MIKRINSGFTLVEIMVVIAIVGILAAIAYPAYSESVNRSKRTEGKTVIMQEVAFLERFFTINNVYTTTVQTSATDKYTLVVTNPTTTSFLITATPTFTDAKCGKLTYDQDGTKAIVGGSETVAYCW